MRSSCKDGPIFAESRTSHSRNVAIELADLHSSEFGWSFFFSLSGDFPGQLWQAPHMALDAKNLEALQLLIREEVQASEARISLRFDQVLTILDGPARTGEKLDQENLALNEQIKRHDRRIDALEKKVA